MNERIILSKCLWYLADKLIGNIILRTTKILIVQNSIEKILRNVHDYLK